MNQANRHPDSGVTSRYSVTQDDTGCFLIRDRLEECGYPAGRDRNEVEAIVNQINNHPNNIGFRVTNNMLDICWDYYDDRPNCEWETVIRNCH